MKNSKFNPNANGRHDAISALLTYGSCRGKHGNDTATTRQRHGNGLHLSRIVTLLLLLTIGVGEMGAATATTVYYAVTTNYTVKCNVNRKGDGDDWATYTMTKSARTYNGKYIYSCSFTDLYDGLGALQFQLYDGSTWKSQVQPISSWTSASTYNGKLYVTSWIDYRYDHTISNSATIVWDNAANTGWTNTYLYKEVNGGSSSNSSAFTRCGSSTQWYKTYASAESKIGKLQFRANTSNWNDGTHSTDLISAGDISGVVLFTYNNSKDGYALNWQVTSPAYKATSGQTVYFDNTVTQWETPRFKYGTSGFNRYADMTRVPGTANLWKYTMPHDLYYGKYKIANEFGWTNYNSIESDNCSKYTALQSANIASATTLIPSTNGAPCTTTVLDGYTRSVTISAPSNGTITVTYTDADDSEKEKTSGSFNVAQTCIITVTASPNSGYVLSSLSVGGAAFTSGNTYTVRANTTISATFAAETTHDVTVSYICTDTEAAVKSGSTTAVGETTASTFEAGTPNGFSFTRWVVGDGLTITAGSTSTNSISVKTKASGTYTLRAEYTEVLTTSWYISGATGSGSPFTGTGTSGTTMRKKSGYSAIEKYYCTISVSTTATGDGFTFNPYNSSNTTNYGNATTDITKDNNSRTVYSDNSTALHFKPYITGDYEFEIDNTGANPVLTVTWPVYNQLRVSAASPTDATNTDNFNLSDQGSNNWSVTRTLNAKTTYTFKIVYNSEWYGKNSTNLTRASASASSLSTSGGNMTVKTDAAGDYTFTFNSSSKNLIVTYPTAYTVTYGSDGHGTVTATASVTGSITSGDYVGNGETVTFSQSPSTGYSLKGWYTTVDGSTSAGLNGDNELTINAAKTVYAQYNPITYSNVTLDKTTGSTDGKYSVTYNATSLTVTTTPAKTGYNIEGYYKTYSAGAWTTKVATPAGALQKSTGYTDANNKWTSTASPTLYTKWTAKQYNITLDKKEGAADGSAKVNYDATSLTDISAPTRTGYHIEGYYGETGRTNKVATAAGVLQSGVTGFTTGTAWTKDDDATLYTKWSPNTYTIAFNDNDENYLGTATGTTASMADVEYDEEVELTDNGFSLAHYSFDGWATTPTGTVAYSDREEVSNLSSTDGATVTLYAKWTGDSYTVSFNKGAGTSLSASSSTVQYGSTYGEGSGLGGEMPTVTAPSGCVFSGWYDAPTGGRKIGKDSVVTATTDHTLYARYTKLDRVYFYNNLGWSDVYVTYDAYWDETNGTGNYEKIYHHMTQIGSSNIWYDEIPSSVLSSWKYFIAFNSEELGTVGESSTWGNFNSGEAVYRRDFDSYATMFVPKTGDTWTKNGGKCTYQSSTCTFDAAEGVHGQNYRHSTGYWMRYNDTKSGYAITGTWDSWANSSDLQAEHAGDDTYIVTKTLAANTTYEFLLYKEYSTNTYNHVFTNTGTMTSANCTNWSFTTNNAKYSSLESNHAKITTTTAGEYVFKLTPGMDGVLKLSVEYPFAVNDYRVTYAWNDGSAHSHSSEIIKAAAGTNETISVFVHKAANVTSQSLTIEKCTGINGSGVATWTAGNSITLSSEDITANGVYNFIITQPASGEPTGAFWKKYDGKYYIRTESSDGGWNYYKDYEDNIMTYSDYSMTQTLSDPYSHYYCRYIENTGMDITYQIATDYSPCVSDIFVGDATIGGVGNTTLPDGNPANIRFSWNEQTNAMRRAYLKSAQGAGNSRYLVMHGYDNKIRNNDATGTAISASGDLLANELQFTDNGNWVYQVSLKAMPGAKVSLIAKYNGSDRYLVGNGSDKWLTIMGGDGVGMYEIAAVYDFKTNRLMTAWTPDGDITDALEDVDLMLIRHAQEAATSITFGEGGSLEANKVIGALRMDYNELVGHVANWTSSSRPLLKFFISFPFDVYVSDVFGLNSAYGDAYVIQRYAGDERARKGFFRGDGTTSFWTDLTIADTLHANVGYCVILDNDYFNGDLGSVWQNKAAGSSVYLYFPSASDVGDIKSTEKTITVPAQECKIDRPFGAGKNHMNTDSHWNLMGVPIFNDHTGVSTAGTPGAIFVTTGDQSKDCHYFYEWSTSNNQFSIRAALGYVFKSMHSYMVQYHGDVTFTGSAIPSSVAPRKQQAQSYTIELNVLNSDADMLNRTYVELREEACDTFELNEDVYMSTNTNAVNIYTFAGNYEAAANVLSIANHTIPVGVEVRTAGTYTISMPNSFRGTATLIDKQTGVRTNLGISDYEVELPKGTINDRFELEISDISNVITDIEYTNGEGSLKDGKAHKFIRNGLLYIVRDGKVYDARGAKVE